MREDGFLVGLALGLALGLAMGFPFGAFSERGGTDGTCIEEGEP